MPTPLLQPLADAAGQPALLGLWALSALALGIGGERLLFVLRNAQRLQRCRAQIVGHLRDGETTMAQAVNATSPAHAAAAAFALALQSPPAAPGPLRRAYQQVVRQAQARLWLLGSIASIAPFIGLMGTVLGVMRAFADIGQQGGGGFEVVSTGISEALVTTAVGIFVGIEAVLLFNFLKVRAAAYAADVREALEEMGEARPEAAPCLDAGR